MLESVAAFVVRNIEVSTVHVANRIAGAMAGPCDDSCMDSPHQRIRAKIKDLDAEIGALPTLDPSRRLER